MELEVLSGGILDEENLDSDEIGVVDLEENDEDIYLTNNNPDTIFETIRDQAFGKWEDKEWYLTTLSDVVKDKDSGSTIFVLGKNVWITSDYVTNHWSWDILNSLKFDSIDLAFIFDLVRYPTYFFNGRRFETPESLRCDFGEIFQYIMRIDDDKTRYAFLRAENAYSLLGILFDAEFYQKFREIQYKAGTELDEYPLEEILEDRISDLAPYKKVPEHCKLMKNKQKYLDKALEIVTDFETYRLSLYTLPLEQQIYFSIRPKQFREYAEGYSIYQSRLKFQKSSFLKKMYGPVNALVKSELRDSSICSTFGGCRMLLCPCHDGEDWFTGYCENCLMKIHREEFALRNPVVGGGWSGTFCSLSCMEENVYNTAWKNDDNNLLTEAEMLDRKICAALFPVELARKKIGSIEKIYYFKE